VHNQAENAAIAEHSQHAEPALNIVGRHAGMPGFVTKVTASVM
jgi:hypothetical protein